MQCSKSCGSYSIKCLYSKLVVMTQVRYFHWSNKQPNIFSDYGNILLEVEQIEFSIHYINQQFVKMFVLMIIFEHILIFEFNVQCLSWLVASRPPSAGLKTWKHISCSYHRRFGIKTNTCGIEATQSVTITQDCILSIFWLVFCTLYIFYYV